jgi:hypothetical protein
VKVLPHSCDLSRDSHCQPAKTSALLTVHNGFGGLHVLGPRLYLDEAEYFFVDFPMVPWRTEILRTHDVTATAQVELSYFFPTLTGPMVGFAIAGRAVRLLRMTAKRL